MRTVTVGGTDVEVFEAGDGPPLVYLHGILDIHTARAETFRFHDELAQHFSVIAPAHPGCGGSGSAREVTSIEDLAFHYLDLMDALGLERANIVGHCLGGWIAAELAVRDPSRVDRLVLINATGLRVAGAPIGDIFMYSVPTDGVIMRDFRQLLFADPNGPIALELAPDGRLPIEDDLRRYRSLTLAGRVGWEPPYLHNPKLRARLHRITCHTLVQWGEHNRMVPRSHGDAYVESIPHAQLHTVADTGHCGILERPDVYAGQIVQFLSAANGGNGSWQTSQAATAPR